MSLNNMLHTILNGNTPNIQQNSSIGTLSNGTNIASQIKALVPGQILQGEVQENIGDVVKLLIRINGEEISLQARMDQNIAVSAGKNLLFQVKNNGNTLSLSPLLENMAMGETVAKALESASLPLNEATLHMTTTLMQEGLPINKDSLQEIYQQVLSNQSAELMDIIDLHKLNMTVNPDNVTQIHSYKEMNHQLIATVEKMSAELFELVNQMAENGQEKEAVMLLRNVLQLPAEEHLTIAQTINDTEGFSADVNNSVQNLQGQVSKQQTIQIENASQTIQNETANLKTAMEPTNILQNMLNELTANRETFSIIFDNTDFKNIVLQIMQDNMLLEPESISDKQKVQEHFTKISKQLNTMAEALQNVAQEQSPFAKSVQNMSQNVNFLNQMNHMYAYIQLPIKLMDNKAHGELYVYSNKKNLAQTEGEVSALLHLDMENLGPVDVYVQMKESNVSTRFYLKDDEMLGFINDHIHILSERLQKRGYNMNCQMTVREQATVDDNNIVFQELLNENSNRPTLVNYSFDVRA